MKVVQKSMIIMDMFFLFTFKDNVKWQSYLNNESKLDLNRINVFLDLCISVWRIALYYVCVIMNCIKMLQRLQQIVLTGTQCTRNAEQRSSSMHQTA